MWMPVARRESEVGERRHDARAHAHGSVIVQAIRCTRGRVIDVSARGVRFHVDAGNVVGCAGGRIELQIRLDGARQRWVPLGGRIGRIATDGIVSVSFFDVPTEFEDVIQDQLLYELECGTQRHALVVDPDPARRARTADRLRAEGWHVTETSSPLEAIDYLGEASAHPSVVHVARTSPVSTGAELRRYLAREHAGVRVRSRDEATR